MFAFSTGLVCHIHHSTKAKVSILHLAPHKAVDVVLFRTCGLGLHINGYGNAGFHLCFLCR